MREKVPYHCTSILAFAVLIRFVWQKQVFAGIKPTMAYIAWSYMAPFTV